jgi:hypothetical protein
MDDRVKRLIDLKEAVKAYFEVTRVGVGGWEAGFAAVRHTNALADSFVVDLRRLVTFIEGEFEFGDESQPEQQPPPARPAGPRPPTTAVSRGPAPTVRAAASGAAARAAAAVTGRPAAQPAPAAAPPQPAAAASTQPPAPSPRPAAQPAPAARRPASGAQATAAKSAHTTGEDKASDHGVEEHLVDPTERVVLPERRGFSSSGRHRRTK